MTTPPQFRAARALLGWSQARLAEEIGVAVLTIKRMENPELGASQETVIKAQTALEAAGVEFTRGGGVKPRKRRR